MSVVTKVNLRKSGMGIEEGTIARWLKAEGDRVNKDDPLVEVETAKAVEEILAPVSGTLTTILVAEGETTAVNTPIAIIQE